jgi:hypothetical protein
MQESTNLEENTRSLMHKKQNKLQMDKSKVEEETFEIVATPKIEMTNDMKWNLFAKDQLKNSLFD